MTDVNLKNFNNKVMLSKKCSIEHKAGKSSIKRFHYKVNSKKPEINVTARIVVVTVCTSRTSQS